MFLAKPILAALLALYCSCTVVSTPAGTVASFGGNLKGVQASNGQAALSIAEVDNATGLKLGTDAATAAAKAYTWGKAFDAAGVLIKEGADVIKSQNH